MAEFSREAIEDMGTSLRTVRMLLETVPIEALKEVVEEIGTQEAIGPLFNPTRFTNPNAHENLRIQKEACILLIKLKKLWRQDVPMEERIQEALDREATNAKHEELIRRFAGGE